MVSETRTRRLPDHVHEVKLTRPTTSPNLYSLLKHSWKNFDEWHTLKPRLSILYQKLPYGNGDESRIKILGELLGTERYPSVSIFNVKILRKESLPIIETLIKNCYTNSNVKFFDKLQSEMTVEEKKELPLTGYCVEVPLTEGFCISIIANECLMLIEGKTQKILNLVGSDRCWQSYEV